MVGIWITSSVFPLDTAEKFYAHEDTLTYIWVIPEHGVDGG